MTQHTSSAEAIMIFNALCQRYSQYLDKCVECPHAGWLASLQWALEESEAMGYRFRIKSFSVQSNRLVPHFSEGSEAEKKAVRDMFAETFYFCPCCGQSLTDGRTL